MHRDLYVWMDKFRRLMRPSEGGRLFVSGAVLKMRRIGNQRQCLEQGTQKIKTSIMGERGLSDLFIGNKGGGITPTTTLRGPL